MQDKEKIIIKGDPLHENNLDGVLNLINKIRLLMPEKTIWLYTGYIYEFLTNYNENEPYIIGHKRYKILNYCDVLIDGRYIDSKRDISLRWRGSKNQRVIDIQKSLQQNTIILYTK